MIIQMLGWAAALFLLAVAADSATCLFRRTDRSKVLSAWLGPVITADGAVIALAVAGAVSPLTAGVLSAIAAVITVFGIWRKDVKRWQTLQMIVAWSFGSLWDDLRAITGDDTPSGGGGAPVSPSTRAVHNAVTTRAIPSVREDPALGPAPEPAAVATIAPVPAPYAALADYIRSFEAADDMELRMFMEGNAAGEVAVADAWHAQGDVLLNSNGLHPAYIAGILEVGDSKAEGASFISQVHKRFGVIYGAVKEWIGIHGPLPHRAREFLSGEDAA